MKAINPSDFLSHKEIDLCDAFFDESRTEEQILHDLEELDVSLRLSDGSERPFVDVVREVGYKLFERMVADAEEEYRKNLGGG